MNEQIQFDFKKWSYFFPKEEQIWALLRMTNIFYKDPSPFLLFFWICIFISFKTNMLAYSYSPVVVVLKEKKSIVKALTMYCYTKMHISFECFSGLIAPDHYGISLLYEADTRASWNCPVLENFFYFIPQICYRKDSCFCLNKASAVGLQLKFHSKHTTYFKCHKYFIKK